MLWITLLQTKDVSRKDFSRLIFPYYVIKLTCIHSTHCSYLFKQSATRDLSTRAQSPGLRSGPGRSAAAHVARCRCHLRGRRRPPVGLPTQACFSRRASQLPPCKNITPVCMAGILCARLWRKDQRGAEAPWPASWHRPRLLRCPIVCLGQVL